jgi:hypothetical protein
MTSDAIKRSLLPEPMKHRSFWQGMLGVSLTVFLPFAARVQSAGETAPSGANPAGTATLSTSDTPPASADAAAQNSAAADTDAPAKLVSTEKPLPPSIRPSGPVAEVVKLANSGLDESVMLAFVTNSTSTFNLGAEEIIYLNDIGVPGAVVTGMIQRDQELKTSLAAAANPPASQPPGPPAAAQENPQWAANSPGPDQPVEPGPGYGVEAPLTPPDEGSDAMFYDSLSPYGNWVDVAGYGRCWQPTVELVSSGWQPYFDCGRWVYSDCGWYWLSDYSWGWAPFHYGNWFRHGRLGWCWTPGRVWGPSWVCWRYDKDFCGWAPLPPGASFTAGVGLTFHGRHVWDGDDLGLRPDHYHFVAWNHFNDRQLRPHSLPPQDAARAYATSTVGTRISGDGHTVINNGLPPSQVVAATHRPIHTVALRELSEPVSIGARAERFEAGGTMAVYRPNPALTARFPSREPGTAVGGMIRSPSGQMPPIAAPPAPRSGSSRHSSNDVRESSPLAGKSAPLILRGPQPSALKESAPASSLVMIGGGRSAQPASPARPWSAVSSSSRLAADPADNNSATKASSPAAVNSEQSRSSRPVANQNQQRNWMGTVSSSPQPAWFAGNESGVGSTRPVENRAAWPEPRNYQATPRAEVPRYSVAPSYAPQRSYSAPAWSAPARPPSFETPPAPSAPAPAVSRSAPPSPQPQSSGRNGR